jgi:hypothetical protein
MHIFGNFSPIFQTNVHIYADLHEIIHEELTECVFPNSLLPDEVVGAVSFITKLEEHISGNIECVTVRTLGIKNVDVVKDLQNIEIPLEIFTTTPMAQRWKVSLEAILREKCPILSKNIVCIVDRKIYRPAPKQTPFLL